jgi:hypothetical protein
MSIWTYSYESQPYPKHSYEVADHLCLLQRIDDCDSRNPIRQSGLSEALYGASNTLLSRLRVVGAT